MKVHDMFPEGTRVSIHDGAAMDGQLGTVQAYCGADILLGYVPVKLDESLEVLHGDDFLAVESELVKL